MLQGWQHEVACGMQGWSSQGAWDLPCPAANRTPGQCWVGLSQGFAPSLRISLQSNLFFQRCYLRDRVGDRPVRFRTLLSFSRDCVDVSGLQMVLLAELCCSSQIHMLTS